MALDRIISEVAKDLDALGKGVDKDGCIKLSIQLSLRKLHELIEDAKLSAEEQDSDRAREVILSTLEEYEAASIRMSDSLKMASFCLY